LDTNFNITLNLKTTRLYSKYEKSTLVFYSKTGNFEIQLQENHVRPPSSFCRKFLRNRGPSKITTETLI